MKTNEKVLLFVVIAVILLSVFAPATGLAAMPSLKTATVHGHVYTQHNRLVPNAAVGLYDPDPPYNNDIVYTDDNGYYSITIFMMGSDSKTFVLSVGGFGAGSATIYPFIVYPNHTYEQNISIQSAVKDIQVTTSKTNIKPDGSDTASINVRLTDMFGDEPSAAVNKIVFTVTNSNYDGSVDGVFESSYQRSYTVMGTTADVTFGDIKPATGLGQVSIDVEAFYNQEDLARNWGYVQITSKSISFNIVSDTPTSVPTINPTPPAVSPQVTVSPTAGPSHQATLPAVTPSPTIGPSMAPGPSPDGATSSPTIQQSASVSIEPSPGPSEQNPNNDNLSITYILGGAVVALLVVVAVMGGYIYGKGKK